MRLRTILPALLMIASTAVAQMSKPDDPDWREAQVAPPASFKTSGLVALEVPRSSLRFGVDPASVKIDNDGVVRYVVVATSTTGTVNAMYEGIRCSTGDFKVYARHSPDSGWTIAKDADWRSLQESPMWRHSLLIARTGACLGRGANRSAEQVVRDLRAPVDTRFFTN